MQRIYPRPIAEAISFAFGDGLRPLLIAVFERHERRERRQYEAMIERSGGPYTAGGRFFLGVRTIGDEKRVQQ